MHQNKIPRPAENRIIRIGDGAVFLIFLQIRCVAPSMANTAIERKSGANPDCKSVRPNSVDSAMLSAVARIIATTHGRTPDISIDTIIIIQSEILRADKGHLRRIKIE